MKRDRDIAVELSMAGEVNVKNDKRKAEGGKEIRSGLTWHFFPDCQIPPSKKPSRQPPDAVFGSPDGAIFSVNLAHRFTTNVKIVVVDVWTL